MGVDAAELARIAALARLRLEPAEMERLRLQLDDILAHIEKLLAIDVAPEQAAPLALPAAAAVRADEPDADPLLRPLAEIAPEWRDGFFTVPRVLAP
jgi:aspartyl-tRNA(Asn)/glutamyl-tRNA(Gln) amidotransferase subunit C